MIEREGVIVVFSSIPLFALSILDIIINKHKETIRRSRNLTESKYSSARLRKS